MSEKRSHCISEELHLRKHASAAPVFMMPGAWIILRNNEKYPIKQGPAVGKLDRKLRKVQKNE